MEDVDNVISFEALYNSMCRCRKGVSWKQSVAGYTLNAIEKTIRLSKALKKGYYKPSPVIKFKVLSPKPRDIASITFRDRIYQRSLNDNSVYPKMSKMLIRDNLACQKLKGTDLARLRLKIFLRRYYHKYRNTGYVAQFDISGYYPNMNHRLAENLLKKYLDIKIYKRVKKILREQYAGDKGYNPGSQLIQIVGISLLNKLDHYVKEVLRCKYYLRYMDDFIIIDNDKEHIEYCFNEVSKMLTSYQFNLNPKKSRIYDLNESIEFLGFNFKLTNTGKVVVLLKTSNVRNKRRKMRRLVALYKKGLATKKQIQQSYDTWANHASKGNTYHIRNKMYKFYNKLWSN